MHQALDRAQLERYSLQQVGSPVQTWPRLGELVYEYEETPDVCVCALCTMNLVVYFLY